MANFPNAYVASIAALQNENSTQEAEKITEAKEVFVEADSFQGPSLILASNEYEEKLLNYYY